jgi:hypothetical protein
MRQSNTSKAISKSPLMKVAQGRRLRARLCYPTKFGRNRKVPPKLSLHRSSRNRPQLVRYANGASMILGKFRWARTQSLSGNPFHQLAQMPRKVISPWGKEVILHQVNDVTARSTHYVSGGTGMGPSRDRANMLPMLTHTVRNAMAYATVQRRGWSAYLYRYAGGQLHVVVVNNDKGTVERQFVVTQYPHDPNLRSASDLRVLYRNGIEGKAGGELPSRQKPSSSSAESTSDKQALPNTITSKNDVKQGEGKAP